MKSESNCVSCGAATHGYFCSHCGEKQRPSQDHSMRHYLVELFHVITHVDSRILRSLGVLISRPGFLSREFLRGRHVRYMTPLRLFFLISVGYYIALTALHSSALRSFAGIEFNTFTTPLAIQLHGNDFYAGFAERQVERKLRQEQVDYATLEKRYDEKTATFSKTLVFVLIPVIALLFQVLLFRKRKYFAEHLVIATHFWSFALLLIGILLPAAVLTLTAISRGLHFPVTGIVSEQGLTVTLQLTFGVYLFLMLRKAYDVSVWYGALIATAIAWSFFFIVWLFRFFLFLATIRAV